MTGLERRLIALEVAPAFSCTLYRAFATHAEAEAEGDPAPGLNVIRIVTGVPRAALADVEA